MNILFDIFSNNNIYHKFESKIEIIINNTYLIFTNLNNPIIYLFCINFMILFNNLSI